VAVRAAKIAASCKGDGAYLSRIINQREFLQSTNNHVLLVYL